MRTSMEKKAENIEDTNQTPMKVICSLTMPWAVGRRNRMFGSTAHLSPKRGVPPTLAIEPHHPSTAPTRM